MSYKNRMEQLDTDIARLEAAEPFVLTQVFPPNQMDWEDAWVAAGKTLPIGNQQELYWYDDIQLRGEYKTLPDQFSMLARSQSTGFQIRDIAGWEDDEHLIVFVVRDDPNAPQGCCRMFMDGTLEQITLTAFTPDGVLGFDVTNGYLWYYEGNDVKYIDVVSEAITTVLTTTGALPEWRFFVVLRDGSGDAYFGAQSGADPNRSLYFWDESAGGSATNVLATFNPGSGAVDADRPMAATLNYVFLSTLDTRAAFDGNTVHQITRAGYTWQTQVDAGTYADEVRTIIFDSDYVNDEISLVVSHLLPSILFQDWNQIAVWDAAGQSSIFTEGQPHVALLRTLRSNLNDHNLDYHMQTRLYYDPSFVADGGNEEHYNNIGALLSNPSGNKYLIHDLGWHTWTVNDAPDIWIFGETTYKIYRISDWQDFDDDVIIVANGILIGGVTQQNVDISGVPPAYRFFELIQEAYTTTAGFGSAGIEVSTIGGILFSDNFVTLVHRSVLTPAMSFYFSELTTNASLVHRFWLRDRLSSNVEIGVLTRQSVRTNHNPGTGIMTHLYSEGLFLQDALPELINIKLASGATSATVGNRWIIRAWRTEPRVVQNGAEYDPSMA